MKTEFKEGDLVRMVEVKGYVRSYGYAKRGESIRKAVGSIGQIVVVNKTARLYPYQVNFNVPYKGKKGTYNKLVWVQKDEIEPLFIT